MATGLEQTATNSATLGCRRFRNIFASFTTSFRFESLSPKNHSALSPRFSSRECNSPSSWSQNFPSVLYFFILASNISPSKIRDMAKVTFCERLCVEKRYLESHIRLQNKDTALKNSHDQCLNSTLIAHGSYRRSHMTQQGGTICHAMLYVTEEMRKKVGTSIYKQSAKRLGKFVTHIEGSLYQTPPCNKIFGKLPKCSLYPGIVNIILSYKTQHFRI